jgi:hypothetical protein
MSRINVTAVGATGNHSLSRTNVNLESDFIYFLPPGSGQLSVPAQFRVANTSYIYTQGVGAVAGITNNALVYSNSPDANSVTFSSTSGGTALNLTGVTNGSVLFNIPRVFNNQLNIDSSTSSNQAVKYYTAGTPITGLVSGQTYFLKNVSVSSFAGSQALYTLNSNTHTFTTCGLTGRLGPTINQMRSAYTAAGTWVNTFLQEGSFVGYQDWTVPVSGIYEIDARGAAGFDGSGAGGVGRGAIVRGRLSLTKGETITIVVGQRGQAPNSGTTWGGSGGGTFVVRKSNNDPLLIAGGGSGESNSTIGRDGVLTQLGGSATGGGIAGTRAGFGGFAGGGRSAGGGGFNGPGENADNNFGGGSFFTGLIHSTNSRIGGNGGFGGGGQSDGNTAGQSGGAGGFSGGAGARQTNSDRSGGGGGSFINASATNVATSTGLFDGISTFNGQPITNLAAFNSGEGTVAVTLVSSFTTGNEVYPTAADSEAGTNRIEIAPAGNAYHAFVPINYDADTDQIHSPIAHGLVNGETISPTFSGTAPAGLSSGSIYYVDRISNFSYKLSSTPLPTLSTINLTTPSARSTSNRISRVVVNTATNTLTINEHGFLVNQPLRYSSGGGTPIGGLVENQTVFVSQVLDANTIRVKNTLTAPSPIDITSAGTGTAHSFIFLTVNPDDDTLYVPNHGLISGQVVRYSNGAGTIIGGLTNNTSYFVIAVDASLIRLSTTAALTSFVNITSAGTGTHTLTVTSLNFTTNTVSIPNHGFEQGELVEYDSRGQTVVNGLTTSTPYYVVRVDKDNIKLSTTPENAQAAAIFVGGVANAPVPLVVDLIESPSGVGVHSLKSLSRTPDGIYEITGEPTEKTFEVTAKGQVPLIVKTFNPRATLDLNRNALKINSHGFLTGTKVTYSIGPAATEIGGMTDATDYYVVALNRDYLRLSETLEDSNSGVTVDLTNFGTGIAHTLTTAQINGDITGTGTVSVSAGSVLVNGSGTSFAKVLKVGDRFRLFPSNTTTSITFASANINTSNNVITAANSFVTGDTAIFDNGGGTSPTPLITNYFYFVRRLSATEITLHNSASDAINNTSPVVFSSQGVGSAFTLTRTIPVGPIIRRITAIGSDTQITVDRPYATGHTAVSYSYPTFVYVRPQGYSLHRPFDGGVEMSAGAGTSLAQIIRQTRKYFRYQSGKGLQTSCGINFKPSIDLDSMQRFSGTQILCRTRRPHGLIDGLFVIVSQAETSTGTPSTIYNGRFQVIVDSPTSFRVTSPITVPTGAESTSYGFPQFYVEGWTNGAVRSGMFDSQNGAFFEFDGQNLYAVRRSSTQQIAGTAASLQGSELVFGTNTRFTAQLDVGDMIVMRGQSYRVVEIESDTRLSIRPEYKGSSGAEKEFNPGDGTTGVVRLADDTFNFINHGFSDNLPLVYNSIDGEAIGGLVNGRTYYVDLIDNNNFKLRANPDAEINVNLSSVGTTTVHSFAPAKSGIIITKTVDTRVPQEQWSIDKADGNGPTGYNLDLSKIQMAYIDYSWYGAGKIRFGFKTANGQVKYLHEFIHNNQLFESYFRSGNLPARYEVVTYDNPTYIPTLFHWGTSVIMDGRFDDDNAYLFTANSQTLNVPGTTAKSFASTGINTTNDLFTVQTHGFRTGDILQFQSLATNGLPGANTQHPATRIVGSQTLPNLTNTARYKAFVNSPNLIHLTPLNATISIGGTVARSGSTVTVVTTTPHNLTNGMYVGIYGITNTNLIDANGPYTVTRVDANTFTYTKAGTAQTAIAQPIAVSEVIDFENQGNSQYTYFLYPNGSLNNTSGPNYQPLISLRLSPSVSEGLTGRLGDRDIINRMQLRLQEIGVSTNQLVDVKVLLNGRLNNLNFTGVDNPSLTQIVEHTSADTVSGGIQVYNFRAAGGSGGTEDTTSVDVSTLFELSNSILGGDSIFPDGPDILTIAVSRLTGNDTLTASKLSWAEAQA